jgi:hypothetical protein
VRGALPLLALAALLLGGPAAAGPDKRAPEITRGELRDLVKTLAGDDFEGREAGTPECDRAADLIAAEFQTLGFEPLGDQGTYFQAFTAPRGMKVLSTCQLVASDEKGRTTELELGTEFGPLDVSAAGDVDAEVVFAGYGISAPELGYDDYEGLDVKGKVVVVLRHAPAYEDRKSPFAPAAVMGKHASFQAKADRAAAAGAAALIVVNDPATFARRSDDVLRPPGGSATGKLPVAHVTAAASRQLGSRIGVSFQKEQQWIDRKVAPHGGLLAGSRVHLRLDLEPETRRMKNVVGLLRPLPPTVTDTGAPPAIPAETVVIGAHYDHVGRGRFGSLANAEGEIHNGADDNASGTAAMLEIAGWLADQRGRLRRQVLFLAFSGEELLGSKHYVSAPAVPLTETVAMLNLDMVGRLKKNRLFVGGTGTSPAFPELIERLNKAEGRFDLTSWPGGKAPSDHTSFYERDVPVLFFFTGLHEDYHRPSDDWNTLEYPGEERVAELAAWVALDLATRDERPQFTRCDAGGFEVGPYLGLAVEQRDDGVYVAHVDDKSPAKRAGFKEGDRIVEWNRAAVPNTNVWNDFLSKAKPGDKVEIGIERDGRSRRIDVKLDTT